MKYIPVLGLRPSEAVKQPVKNHFNDYLVSIAEPTTSRGWSLQEIVKHVMKIEELRIPGMTLYLDSGGYQVITGHITENRIREFTDVYHFILEYFRDSIDIIFSLDINTPKFSKENLKKYNDYSIDSSIALIKKYPEFMDKQMFVVQSRVPKVLNEWLELMDEHKIYKYYKRYSFGGLVGLKSETRVQFNHFVPMVMWLLTYLKSRGGNKPLQIHMLGQSSRVALITGTILEKLTSIDITMDSSEVVRFRPISASIPMVHKTTNFSLVTNLTEMTSMIDSHSELKTEDEIIKLKNDLSNGLVSNTTFVELICQNINNVISLADFLLETVDVNTIIQWNKEDFESFHDVFKVGRLSTELENNMRLIRRLLPHYENNEFDKTHTIVENIIGSYYDGSKNKKGL